MFKTNTHRFKKPIVSLLVFLFALIPLTSVLATDPLPEELNSVVAPGMLRWLLPNSSQSGALIHEYPITVPLGRNGLQPDLKLIYNNQNNEEGSLFGFGWDINIPSIQRIAKTGVDNLYSASYFSSSLDGELVSTGTTTLMAKVESGDFRTYNFSNNQWIVKDKNGTQYKFGYSASTRQDDPSNSSHVYKWMLEEVRDTNNNYIKYEYYKDAGQIYPSHIVYTGNDTTDGIFEITFSREARDDVFISYRTGFSVETDYIINDIEIEIDSDLVREYELDYSNGVNGLRSLLVSITESGIDELDSTVTLPATTLEYEEETPGWTYNSSWTTPVYPSSPFQMDYANDRVIDVNGDGLVDILSTDDGTRTYINNGEEWVFDNDWEVPNFRPGQARIELNSGNSFVVDINGDALADIIYGTESVYINQGLGWEYDDSWEIPELMNGVDYNLDKLADVNGDGLIDIVSTRHGYEDDYTRFYINNGSGWDYDQYLETPFIEGVGHFALGGANAQLVDINGDNLVDIFYDSQVYLNQGYGWVYDNSWEMPVYISVPIQFSYYYDKFSDVNGDGLIDIVSYRDGYNRFYINDGEAWNYDSSWELPGQMTLSGSSYNGLVDIDGDGLVDIVYLSSVYMNNGNKVDLLTTINNNKGGFTDVTYKPATQYFSGATPLNPNLPFVLDTVYQMTINDGLGGSSNKTYSYEGGEYYFNNYLDRKFAGFGKVASTDDEGNTTVSFFHQGNATNSTSGEYSDDAFKIGKIYRSEVADDSDNLYSATINKWDNYDLGDDNAFVKLVQKLELTYDGDNDHIDRGTLYTYDNDNGNLTQKEELGQVTASANGTYTDSGTDDFTTSINYAENTNAYILGLPSQETIVDHNSNKVKESKYYYDSQSLGSVLKGNLTKKEDWKDGANYINVQKTYDATYGLLTSDIDARGKTTSYTYDAYHLYPVTVTNPLSQETDYIYDYSAGNAKQITDPNDRVFQNVYDGLDRLLQEKQPDIDTPANLVVKNNYAYTDTAGAVSIHKTENLDAAVARETYQYFDGLNRLIQERKEAEGSDYEVKDIIYNNRGLVDKESLNYFSSGTSKTSATTTTALYINYTYDPLARVITSNNAVGTTTNTYDDWKLTITDAKNNTKDLYKDAYDKLAKVDEHNDASTHTTEYDYNYLGNLTNITDALDNVRNFTYDGLGRRLTAEDLHNASDNTFGSWSYAYDDAGNLTQTVDPKSQTVNYTYDDLNRQLTENYTGQAGTEITYSYDSGTDGIGRLTGITTADLTQANTYNPLGLIKSESKTINGTNYQTGYEYDRQGNQTLITYPDDTEVKYEFNAAGQLEKVSKKASGEQSYTEIINDYDYNPMGQTTFRQFENGAQNWNSYDADKLYRQSYRFTLLPDTGSSGSGMLLRALDENEAALSDVSGGSLLASSAVSASKQTITKKMRDWYNKMSKTSAKAFTPISAIPAESLDSYNETVSSGARSMLLLENNSAPNWPTNQLTEGLWLSESLTFNSGFEDSFNNWTFYTSNNATNAADCTVSYSGDCSDKVIVSTSGNYWDSMVFQTLRLDANTNYKLKFKAKAATSTSIYIGANQNHDPWYVLGLHKSINVGTDWKEYEYSFTSWDTDENARIFFGLGENTTTYWIDDVELVPDSLNKVKNPSFENGSNDWSFWSYGGGGAAGTNSVICTDSTKGDCSDYVDMTASGDYWQVQLTHGVSVSSSDTYVITFDAKAGAARNIGLSLAQNHDPWWDLTSTTNISLGTSWDDYELELTPSQTDSNARLMFYLGTSAADVSIDNVRMWKKQNTRMTDMTPEFSAIYDDPDSGDIAPYYQIQVIGRYDSFDDPLWDSGKTALSTSVTEGNRTVDLGYAGTSLYEDGQKYHWRMRLWDDDDSAGSWSNGRDYFIMSGKRVQDIGYYYDNVGNITKIEDFSDTDSAKTADYTYDDLNRLTQAEITDVADGQSRYTEDYSYNALGNILSKTGQGNYSYAGDQGTNYANPHAATTINGATQSYDNNGNLTDDSIWDYTWDYRNRLIGATNGTTTMSYGYDNSDNRIWSNNGTATTTYPTKYYNVASTGTTTRQIFAGNELVATIEGTDTHYVHTDHLGGSSVISDADGNLEETMDYYPFGGIRLDEKEGSFNEQRKFTGYEYDNETNLNYAGARYQNGNVGRFISQDLVSKDNPDKFLIDPQQLNTYAYSKNNPLKFIDPTGLTTEVNSSTGAIMNSINDGNSAIIAYPYVNGARAEGPGEYWGDSTGNVQGPLNNTTWDNVTNERISGLDSKIQESATQFINYVELQTGARLRVTEGYRSIEKQNKLYNQSRTNPPTGPWATNAKGGESYHNYGLAIDVVTMKDGKPVWSPVSSDIANFGIGYGFEWGGYWHAPVTDYPHFQMTLGQSISDLMK